jgi:hypothetical protein
MAYRTNATDVKAIIDTQLTITEVTVFISTANLIVTTNLGNKSLSVATLTEIEKWVSAHLIAITKTRQALKKKVRHSYDLYHLLQQKEYSDFLNSDEFEKMLIKVAKEDMHSFKNNNEWLNNHPTKALIFNDLDNVWNKLKKTYNVDFKELVYGTLPDEKDVLAVLKMIKKRIENITWIM